MAKPSVGFFDKHLEKLILGVCALAAAGSAVFSLGGSRFAQNERTPSDLCRAAGEAADQTRQKVQNARPVSGKTDSPTTAGNDPVAQLNNWFGEKRAGLPKVAGVAENLPRTQAFPTPFHGVTRTGEADRHQLAKLITPGVPMVVTGRTTLKLSEDKPEIQSYNGEVPGGKAKPITRSWVSVAAQVDILAQYANFLADRYPPGSYLPILKVYLQRKDSDDPSRGWEDVDVYLPFKPLTRPKLTITDGKVRVENTETFRRLIEVGSDFICRPRLPTENAKDLLPPMPYLDAPPSTAPSASVGTPGGGVDSPEQAANKRAKKWMDLAKKAIKGSRPFGSPDYDSAYILASAAANTVNVGAKEAGDAQTLLTTISAKLPRGRFPDKGTPHATEKLMPIAAHDIDAPPGRSYVYRIRYEILNIYAGNPGELTDPSGAELLTRFSDWSPPSRPVAVQSDTYFYLTLDKATQKLKVAVFKVNRQNVAIKKEYPLQLGEPIGRKEARPTKADFSTGAVCIDIDTNRLVDGKKDVSMIYVDMSDGLVHERLLSRDRTDRTFKKLNETKPAAPPR